MPWGAGQFSFWPLFTPVVPSQGDTRGEQSLGGTLTYTYFAGSFCRLHQNNVGMLLPAPESSLQRRRMVWARPWRVRGLAALLGLVYGQLCLVGAWSLGQFPATTSLGPPMLAGLAVGLLGLMVIGWRRLPIMRRLHGGNPSTNRQILIDIAQANQWALRADEPAYLIIDFPPRWYLGTLQVTVLFQGRDLWLHVAGRGFLGSINLLSWLLASKLRDQLGRAFDQALARQEWEGNED